MCQVLGNQRAHSPMEKAFLPAENELKHGLYTKAAVGRSDRLFVPFKDLPCSETIYKLEYAEVFI